MARKNRLTNKQPLFKKIDCFLIRVPDLDKALDFYSNRLGHELRWRKKNVAAGLRLGDTELVLLAEKGKMEVDLLVSSVPKAIENFVKAGGKVVRKPFDIDIGKCAVVRDPFGNILVLLDTSKGLYKTDKNKNIIGRRA